MIDMSLKVQSQGLKTSNLKKMFAMWVSCYVAQGIIVNIFLIKRFVVETRVLGFVIWKSYNLWFG